MNATDEALFANTNFLEKNAADVDKIVEAILTTWREVTANPAVVTEWRAKYKLLPDLPAAQVTEIGPYFEELAKGKALPAQWRRRCGREGRLRLLHPLGSAHR